MSAIIYSSSDLSQQQGTDWPRVQLCEHIAATALFKIVVTPHFTHTGRHAKLKSGDHNEVAQKIGYLVKLELWNSYPPCHAPLDGNYDFVADKMMTYQ